MLLYLLHDLYWVHVNKVAVRPASKSPVSSMLKNYNFLKSLQLDSSIAVHDRYHGTKSDIKPHIVTL